HIPLESAKRLGSRRILPLTHIQCSAQRQRDPHRRGGRTQASPSRLHTLPSQQLIYTAHLKQPCFRHIAIQIPSQHVDHPRRERSPHHRRLLAQRILQLQNFRG